MSNRRFAVVRNVRCSKHSTPTVARAFERTRWKRLRGAGARRSTEITLAPIQTLGTIQATGGFSAAESYADHRLLLERSAKGELRPARCACASNAAPA